LEPREPPVGLSAPQKSDAGQALLRAGKRGVFGNGRKRGKARPGHQGAKTPSSGDGGAARAWLEGGAGLGKGSFAFRKKKGFRRRTLSIRTSRFEHEQTRCPPKEELGKRKGDLAPGGRKLPGKGEEQSTGAPGKKKFLVTRRGKPAKGDVHEMSARQ